MKKNERLELTAGRLIHGGKCLSSYEGKVAFIENCVPGDRVIGIVKKIKSDYIEVAAEKVINNSPLRQTPICSHFGVCGGCNLQYMSYQAQLDSKKQIVEDIFNRIGKLKNINVNDVIGSDKTIYYRNKMEYSFSDRRWLSTNDDYSEGEKKFALGLHIPNRYDKVLHLNECFLQSQLSNQIRNFIGEYFFNKGISVYSSKNQSGYLKSLIIRESFHTDDKMVNLVTTTFEEKLMTELAEIVKTNFPQVSTFVNNITGINLSTTIGSQIKILYGEGKIIEKLLGYEFEISSNSFFQTNTLQAEKMFMKIEEILLRRDRDILLDFYCGAGVIGIILAKYFNEVFGFESNSEAIHNALINANRNKISNIKFSIQDLNKKIFMNGVQLENKNITMILDPPRAGLTSSMIDFIKSVKPKTIIYVSCNPATQARDVFELHPYYRVFLVQPFDLFPHTYHIENIIVLEKI